MKGPETPEHGEDLHGLKKELDALRLEYKKQARRLDKALMLVERNRIAAMSKDNLSKVISSDKSKLERYMNLLLENCPDIIMIFDEKGCIVYCTEVLLKLGNIPAFGVIAGKSYREFLAPITPPGFVDKMDAMFEQVQTSKQTAKIKESLDFTLSEKPLSYSIQLAPMLDSSGGHAGAIAFFHDTTELVRAMQEAERANRSKSDFLATVSHEIRTPMNAIIGLSDMMKSAGLDEEQLNRLEGIRRSSHVLLNLINDILDFSKIDAGKLELTEDYFSLPSLLLQIKSMFETMFAQKNLAFDCNFSKSLPEVVFGDDKRIGQILTNIINNALKYTERGGVVLRVYSDEKGICIEVEDSGIGIREDALPKIFTAFEQLDLVRNKNVVGTGLGLAISKRLCALMNGSIEVESEYGIGSVFRIRLPLIIGSAKDMQVLSTSAHLDFKAPNARVLLVDDIEINLQIAEFMLEDFGIVPDTAANGKLAVEMVKQNHYDLIFMDHMMPEMDGVEATGIIRAMEGSAALTPIVALTANAVSEAKNMFLQNGFDDFLSKPMEVQALADAIYKWLPPELIIVNNSKQ